MKNPLLVIGNKNYSSWSLRAWLVLQESGIEFDELRIPLHTDDLSVDIERIRQIWETSRAEFGANGPNLFGSFTIADAFYAPVVCRFVTYGVELPGEAGRYMQAVLDRPSLRAWLAAGAVETESIDLYEVGR